MNNKLEISAFVLAVVFAASVFMLVPRDRPHIVSYKNALELEKAIENGGGEEPFYDLSRTAYAALWGQEFNKENFDFLVMYMSVALGLVCATAFYLAVRSRMGPEMSLLGVVILSCSPALLVNAAAGVYAPALSGVALFSVALMLFLASGATRRHIGILLAAGAGALAGVASTFTESGFLLAAVLGASALVQLAYYVREGDYKWYALRFLALVVFSAPFLAGAKYVGVRGEPNPMVALSIFALLLPLLAVFVFAALRDLVRDKKEYEMFVLAVAVGSVGISLFDAIAASPGIALGAIFGLRAVRNHMNEKWTVLGFLGLIAVSASFLFLSNLVSAGRAFVLSLFIGSALAGILLLYEKRGQWKLTAFVGMALVLSVSMAWGVLIAQKQYSTLDTEWSDALHWIDLNTPEDAVIAMIGPQGASEYLADRQGCDCDAEVARFLLSDSDTSGLRGAGATHLVVDEAYFNEIRNVASVGNLTRVGMETFFFVDYYFDSRSREFFGYFVSEAGQAMRVPVDSSGIPVGSEITVDGIGKIPYGKIRRFGDEEGVFSRGSRVVLPLYGGRVNLFDIYFETPIGLSQLYPDSGGRVRVFEVS